MKVKRWELIHPLFLLTLLNVMDWLLTVHLIDQGWAREGNPLMGDTVGVEDLLAKLILCGLLATTLVSPKKWYVAALWLLVLVLSGVIAYEAIGLKVVSGA